MGVQEGWDGEEGGLGVCVGGWGSLELMTADQLTRRRPNHLHIYTESKSSFAFLSLKRESVLVHLPKLGKILSLSHIRITRAGCKTIQSRKRAFYKMFLFLFVLFFLRLFLCYGVKVGGEKCLLSRQPFHTMNPSPLCKYKMRNRIMHVFPKICFLW